MWRLLTFALLIYLCADVSVFEYYEGNLSLGIISYRQAFSLNSPDAQSADLSDDSLSSSKSYPHSDTDNLLFDDSDCFCCTAHAAFNPIHFAITLLPLTEAMREPNFINSQSNSEYHSPPYYRPPQFI
jgi:hypothetical protein